MPEPKPRRQEPIAIVGSGPGGLTCAYYLALEGYPVTIYEALPVAGGMLATGIPDYRLPKDVLNYDIEIIRKLGVDIRTGIRVGNDVQLSDLQRDYAAVFIATGFTVNMIIGSLAGIAASQLRRASRVMNRLSAIVFGGLAARLLID